MLADPFKSPPKPASAPAPVAARRPRVLLLIESYAGYGRAILEGIIHHAEQHAAWDLMHERRPRITPETLGRYPDADGIIAEARSAEMLAALQGAPVPAVLVTGLPRVTGLPQVAENNAAVGRLAFEHFRDLGFRRVGYCGYRGAPYSDLRERAFITAAEAEGFESYLFLRPVQGENPTDRSRDEEEALATWLRGLPKPIAILGTSDALAQVVASACRLAGIIVPEEVAILGVDNDDLECNLSLPPLSSIDHGMHRVGYEAAALLARWLAGGAPPTEPIIIEPVGVVVRQSTNTLAIENRDVAAAVRYIREHAVYGIKMTDVLEHIPVARRTLELNFKRILGRTVHQEILRVRLEQAKQLLIQTDWPMPKVSVQCGFSYASQFSTVFRRALGTTPRAYRQRWRAG